MPNQNRRFSSGFLMGVAGVLLTLSCAQAKDKTAPAAPKDAIEVVGHVPLVGGPVTRFLSTQHYSSYYLYAEHGAASSVTLLDITKAAAPSVLTDVSYSPAGTSEGIMVVAGTAALVNSEPAAATAVTPQMIKIMDFSDPRQPKVAREFTGVTAVGRDDSRHLVFIANGEGIWILQQRLAEDPEAEKAYADYVQYLR